MLLAALVFATEEENPLPRIHPDPVPTAEQKRKAREHLREEQTTHYIRYYWSCVFPLVLSLVLSECLRCDTGRKAKAPLLTSAFDDTLRESLAEERRRRTKEQLPTKN